ncbi:cupin domain-containing protein [Herbidospora mongoliensis]|uniref:cupin domain-containing protein n=1 Tax=Herbidospora mongoliensis TaxID=688067 RepID=UPI000AD83874|nr:cupin domain-containing protein [Herbidospora mongoliensis]
MTVPLPDFPGSAGITELDVYPGGGTPHLHLACTECYVVVGGSGSLETLTSSGPDKTDLTPGDVVWFEPGTIHRAVSHGNLKVVVVMQNGGLPEAGDAVMTFPPDHLTSPEAYRAAASILDAAGRPSVDLARRRRDLALEGFHLLQESAPALREFHRRAAALVSGHLPRWRAAVESGPLAQARRTLDHIDALAAGRSDHLGTAQVAKIGRFAEPRLGMCGFLSPYDLVRRGETTG